MGRRARDRGFTAIELLVVVAVLGALLAIAMPAWNGIRMAAAMASAEQDVAAALQKARWLAITSGRPVTTVSLADCSGSDCRTLRVTDGDGRILATVDAARHDVVLRGTNVPFALNDRGFLSVPGRVPGIRVAHARTGNGATLTVTPLGKVAKL